MRKIICQEKRRIQAESRIRQPEGDGMVENRQYIIVVDSAREKAYQSIRNKIVNLELPPGTSISMQDMAEQLEISRTPVREAFLRLQGEHLMEISPQKRSIVSRIDLKMVEQECFIREAFEVENMRLFVTQCTDRAIEEMRENIELQREAAKNRNYERYQELDNEFHLYPFRDTDQELAASMLTLMNGHYDRTRMLIRRSQEISNDIIGEHTMLLRSIMNRDVEKTIELLRKHIHAYQSIIDALKQKCPDYFV